MNLIRIQAAVLFCLLVPLVSWAGDPDSGVNPQDYSTEGKREFLKKHFAKTAKRSDLKDIHARLDRMSASQLEQLINVYQRKMAKSQRELEKALALRRQLQQQLQMQRSGLQPAYPRTGAGYPRMGGGGAVGYRPVITWLPQGTSLGVSGVVSPDRRYVRINANPFFSHIPNVDTFNFRTGETRRYPQPPPEWPRRTTNNSTRVEKYHDGLRTRYRRVQN